MTIEGKIETARKATTRLGEDYVVISTKGRKFITFDPPMMNQLVQMLGLYVSIDYGFFKDNRFPNFYKLVRVIIR